MLVNPSDSRIPVLVLAGPTASGKTALSLDLAEKLSGEIVSADSMQLYCGMDIGTAKPSAAERRGIPHFMLDILEPAEEYSVAEYAKRAREEIRGIAARGKTPIVVGGTGLYISTLVENIRYEDAEPDPAHHAELESFAAEQGAEALHRRLLQADPDAAEAIHAHNVKRVLRALEMKETTGLTLAERNERSRSGPEDLQFTVYALSLERDVLYERIDRRVDLMEAAGLVEEVRRVAARGMGKTARQAIGYKEILEYLEGRASLPDALDQIRQNSRHYAKRQLTWFRRPSWVQWKTAEELRGLYKL